MASSNALEEEFRDFVAARSGALLRTAYLLTGDWGTAEDLVQTALTKTYLAWKRLGGIEAIEPYTRRVMVNTSTSWWRRRWHGERPTEVLPEQAATDELERQLDRDVLWRHLRALPARQRAVLVLRFYEDMSEAQTAAMLDISPGTVKSQTSRALATLRRRIGAEEPFGLRAGRSESTEQSTDRTGPGSPQPEDAGRPVRAARRRPAGTATGGVVPALGAGVGGATASPDRISSRGTPASAGADGRDNPASAPGPAAAQPGALVGERR
ncbi:SigE family RNA polymerase sigma factor [Verrucosispora sp. WMMA2044]|uniref:SigE family RNA polymerase sigma factor n=1 Tax=Verrucosispora sp. WMMA2044 TaxID=3016419 RepID=UPI00248CEEE5|nr:SigE family RNA polymerase sigma factor [Verrucosispora sp. WMMA2044]WBB47731.1 SigE family RNA polymerase sigma factor [Verrucosispora sp. WMMA2044]